MKTGTAVAVIALLAASMIATDATAQSPAPDFARIFGDHAVLQRDRPIRVWGHAAPRADVTVALGTQSAATRADADGRWRATLPAMPAGGPYRLTVTAGGATTTLTDIALGDVVLCSGQSNMEFQARFATGALGGLSDTGNPDLRFVTIAKDSAPAAREDLKTPVAWKVAAPDTVGDASAVCYRMARALQHTAKVPVGFIASSWGGTTIQGWISAPSLRTVKPYAEPLASIALLASDPRRAMAQDERRVEAWWDAHDPQARTQRAWIAPGFDDSAWATITPGAATDTQGPLAGFAGVVWLRTVVTLTEAQARGGTTLQLGPIDTYDSAWINGVRVGASSVDWVWREYPIPAGTLKPGRNVVTLRVLGTGRMPGPPGVRAVRLDSGETVPLDPVWRVRTGMRATGLKIPAAPWEVPNSLSTLYNGMIAPIAPYGLKLAAWYQGESNVGAAAEYATLLPLLMADWRRAFAVPDLPFVVAQLSSYGPVATAPVESDWAKLRDVQAKSVAADGHAGLAVTIDVGDRTDIHPTQKTVVGERLARAARAVAYGEAVTPGGPEAIAVERRGADLVVRFRNAGTGLRTYSAAVAIGFEACADRCRFVAGTVAGDTIVLPGANTPAATRVRYAWADAPYVNLYSADDLPAVPFERAVE